jgi:superfamily II DNA or RNA helicase
MATVPTFLATLRDYQLLAYRLVLKRIEEGCRRFYISLPPGTGKSLILTALAARRRTEGRILVLVHLRDLVNQLAQTLKRAELDVGMVMHDYRQIDHTVVVGTPQSLLACWSDFVEASEIPIRTVLIDEAHHAVPGSRYEEILSQLEAAYLPEAITVAGFTATPFRSDTKSMLSLLPTCAFIREIPEMINAGWLAPLTWVPFRLDLDLSTLPSTTETGECDYAQRALTQTLVQPALMEEIVRQTVPHLGQRPTLVFALSVEHAEHLATLFCQAGRSAVAVSGNTSPTQRERIYDQWRTGSIQIVCNCRLLTEGFDFPDITALVIARPTRSPSLYLQMLGRGTRLAPGKQDCLVLDLMGNAPDLSQQILLPQILGIRTPENLAAFTGKQTASPPPAEALYKQIQEATLQTGLSILDPFGISPYRWNAYGSCYFAMIDTHVAVLLEPDKNGSGLYHSRLYTMKPGQKPIHQWIERTGLPLRQQVALIHEATGALYQPSLASKDAPWLNEPATDKQRAIVRRMYPKEAEQTEKAEWTKGDASKKITAHLLSSTFNHPPSPEKE